MLLLIDIGNSNISFAVYNDNVLINKWRIKTDKNKTADEYAIILNVLLNDYSISGVVIASVVPLITELLATYCDKYLSKRPLIIGRGLKTGLDIKLNNPKELGADLIAEAVGVIKKYPQPCIIIDMGTATTLALIDNNAFYGGIIYPGVETSLASLVMNTALLPQVNIQSTKRVIEKETAACMQSGIVYGTAAMLDGLIDMFEKEHAKKCFIVATGGLAKYIIPYCKHQITIDSYLIYEGLSELYNKNNDIS